MNKPGDKKPFKVDPPTIAQRLGFMGEQVTENLMGLEPSVRALAKYRFMVYQAHIDAGFTPDQATSIMVTMTVPNTPPPTKGK